MATAVKTVKKQKIALPPRPKSLASVPPATKAPAAKAPSQHAVRPSNEDKTDLRGVKAVKYVITLDDGSELRAEGEHADLIFRYLSECERTVAAAGTVVYQGPSLARYDAEGNFMAQAAGIDPASVRS